MGFIMGSPSVLQVYSTNTNSIESCFAKYLTCLASPDNSTNLPNFLVVAGTALPFPYIHQDKVGAVLSTTKLILRKVSTVFVFRTRPIKNKPERRSQAKFPNEKLERNLVREERLPRFSRFIYSKRDPAYNQKNLEGRENHPLMRGERLELSRDYSHYPLKVARLPIPPPAQIPRESYLVKRISFCNGTQYASR
jgi:hypothetical protein